MSFGDIEDLIFIRFYVRHPIQKSKRYISLKPTKRLAFGVRSRAMQRSAIFYGEYITGRIKVTDERFAPSNGTVKINPFENPIAFQKYIKPQ